MFIMDIIKIRECVYDIPKFGKMNVPVRIYANEKLLEKMKDDKSMQQGINVACMPGIYGRSIMMADAHQGYGFSIGGVAAFDAKDGCISPGGIGYDINCGVRLLRTTMTREQILPKIEPLLNALFELIPCGVGRDSELRLTDAELDDVLRDGAQWALSKGYGTQLDIDHCEESGKIAAANPGKVSHRAKARGRKQLGTLGAGNHFVEVQFVDAIHDEKAAAAMGITKTGQAMIMIHCGSRGLGHQVCSDYLRTMEEAFPDIVRELPEKELIYAPAQSKVAQDYFAAMCASANFAWANRHMIGHQVRAAFDRVFGSGTSSMITTVYDVAHNMAKLEEYTIEGKKRQVYVHRKGATRAFGPGRAEICEDYRAIGQPVIIPGSMGTSSWVLVGTEGNMEETFGSTAHGAGRAMSRHESIRRFEGKQVKEELLAKNIHIKAASWKGISEEAPGAYKEVDDVIEVTATAGIGKPVAQLRPIGVIKG
ncbi:MAG: RtcB family protein [Nanoarchaeota archaeon]